MATQQLPGFFYDEEKKKYFKIMRDSAGTGGKYAAGAIKLAERTRESAARSETLQRRRLEQKQRQTSKMAHKILYPVQYLPTSPSIPLAWTLGTQTIPIGHKKYRYSDLWVNDLTQASIPSPQRGNLGKFLHWPYGTDYGKYKMIWTASDFAMGPHGVDELGYMMDRTDPAETRTFGFSSPISSIKPLSTGDLNGVVVTQIGGGGEGSSVTIYDLERKEFSSTLNDNDFRTPKTMIWDCAVSLDNRLIALAGLEQILTLRLTPSGPETTASWRQTASSPRRKGMSYATALDFLDVLVLLRGWQNGRIGVWDHREEAPRPNHLGVVTTHESGVAHIRAYDDYCFLVAGLNHWMWMYDIRMGRPLRDIKFIDYHNVALNHTRLGLDIWPPLDLIAVATDYHTVQLFNAKWGWWMWESEKLGGVARCLQFVDDGADLKLLATTPTAAFEWKVR